MTTIHHAQNLAIAVGITTAAYLAIAYPVWRIRHARRTRQRYARGQARR